MVDTFAPGPPEAEDRVRFTASDVRAMLDAGILDDERRYEVIDGEIVEMMVHNPPHIRVKRWLLNELTLQLGRSFWVDSEPTFYLEPDGEFTVPDIMVYPRTLEGHLVRGPDASLVIEVADKSLKKDRGRKARLYARHGVRDYWVVNALTLATTRYADPANGRYGLESEHGPDEILTPLLLDSVRLKLRDVEG
jgi:Uma2 family endonuclease